MTTPRTPLPYQSEWTFPLLDQYHGAIKQVAHDEFKLDTFPIHTEIITADRMCELYVSAGIPVAYADHWFDGMDYLQIKQGYQKGQQGLAYEIVRADS